MVDAGKGTNHPTAEMRIPKLDRRADHGEQGSFGTAILMVGGTLGALYYGQSALIYPSSVPPGSRTSASPLDDVSFHN
ncbi:hypothetical protein CALVIDRAFT_538890 [Calocera viscosa TUFC12733]|uniref:Uncharacterized protein n=1 Tax=Calocera viscosa (strain TUFC12733) TaxID=1330018 RepID=A0A167KAI2_CALVF|nr:hypothetical protein CALVIDRAFT_538890 [Calocera viscosa TUFC12733]